jgi:regulator of sirC expression with transglutaminase-like and TPR domain
MVPDIPKKGFKLPQQFVIHLVYHQPEDLVMDHVYRKEGNAQKIQISAANQQKNQNRECNAQSDQRKAHCLSADGPVI